MILAQQIDQEISELRSVFEGHREEMLSLLDTAPQVPTAPAARRSPIAPLNMTLPGGGGGGGGREETTRQNVSLPASMEASRRGREGDEVETESDSCVLTAAIDRVRLDRKKEFEKRRQSVQNRRRKVGQGAKLLFAMPLFPSKPFLL